MLRPHARARLSRSSQNSQPWITGAPAALPSDKSLALANGGQKRLVRQEHRLLCLAPAAKDGQGRSYADTTLLLWPLVRQDRQRIWRRTVDRGGQNEDEGSRGARRERRGKREQSVLSPWSVVKVGLCARDSRQGSPARPGQGPSQNDLRRGDKWFAQWAK